MSKITKSILGVFVVILVLLIVGVVAIGLFADSAVKAGIETAGSKALNVKVSVDKVDLSIIGGSLGFSDLVIGNPPGYQHDNLLQLNEANIKVDTRSLLTDKVRINEIRMDGMNLVLEQKGISNNLNEIIKSIPHSSKTEAEPTGKKLNIDNLEISNVVVNVKLLPVPGKVDTVTLKLSPIKMTDLGSDDKLDIATLTSKILLAIAGGVAEQGAGVLPKDMVNTMTSTMGKVVDMGIDIIGDGTGTGQEAIKGTEDIGKGITEGLKGILKPKQDQ
jgi:hypothetical protein